MHGLEALKSSGAFGTALPQVLRLTRKATPPHTDTLTHSHALSHPAPVSQTKVRWPRRAPKRRWPVRAPKEQPRHNQGTKSLDPKRASCWISVEPYPRRVSKSLSLVSGFTHTHTQKKKKQKKTRTRIASDPCQEAFGPSLPPEGRAPAVRSLRRCSRLCHACLWDLSRFFKICGVADVGC